MKPRGIWIIIGLILVIGIGTTAYTREYTSKSLMKVPEEHITVLEENAFSEQEGAAAMAELSPAEKPAAEQPSGAAAAVRKAVAAGPEAETVSVPDGTGASADFHASSEEGQLATGSQADPAPAAVQAMFREVPAKSDTGNTETAESVIFVRLRELDEQIEKNRAENQDTTSNALRAAAETERKLWEAELSRYLGVLEDHLERDVWNALMKEQNEWVRRREADSLDASRKQASSTLQELEYNLSMKEITRARVYELAEEYKTILSEAEK